MTNGAAFDVAIIIAAYNAEATILKAVQSALAEPEVVEVVVVDDASIDNTAQLLSDTYKHNGRVRLLRNDQNRGPAACRNKAIAATSSPWIAVLDSDDFFLSGRIHGLILYSAGVDLVADNMWRVDEQNVSGPRTLLLDPDPTAPTLISFKNFIRANVTLRGRQRLELGFIKPLMRRSFLEAHNIAYNETLRLGEDFELYARVLALGGKLVLIAAQGYVSVIRARSLSGIHTEADLLNLRQCTEALSKLPNLDRQSKKALAQHYLSIDCRLQWRLLILAIKTNDRHAVLRAFLRPLPVPVYLAKKLIEQAVLRIFSRRH